MTNPPGRPFTTDAGEAAPVSQIAMEGIPAPAPIHIHSVARDAEGRLYLSDEFNHRVIILDAGGKCLGVIGKRGGGPGEFWYPRGLAIVNEGADARLAVCDAWNHRIQVFGADGAHLRSFGSIGEGEGQFNEPCVVLPGNGGNVWVLDRCNHRIKLCSLGGATLKTIGFRMTVRDEDRLNDPVSAFLPLKDEFPPVHGFFYPMSMARLEGGDFIVADTNNGRLVRMGPDGTASQILNIRGEAPPYLFPSWVGNMGGGFVAVRGFSGPFRLMELARPWSDTILDIGDDALIAASADGSGEVMIIDARNGRISLRSPDKRGTAASPPIFTIDPSTAEVSRSWADRNGQSWFSYLSTAPESDSSGELAGRFTAMIRNETVKAGNRLSETESEYLKNAAEYHTIAERMKRERAEAGAPSSETRSAFNWQTVTLKRIEAERNELRRILIQNLSWGVNLASAKSAGFLEKYLSGEVGALRRILEDELKARAEDYRHVNEWLIAAAEKPIPPAPAALLNAVAGMNFLFEHARYLKRALKSLGSEAWRDAPSSLPWAVFTWRGRDSSLFAESYHLALGLFYRQAGRHGAAIGAYKNAAAQDVFNKRHYEIQAGAAMLMGGDVEGAVGHWRALAESAAAEPQTLLMIVRALMEHNRDEDASAMLRKLFGDLKPEDPLYFTALETLVYSLKNTGRFDEALELIGEMEKTAKTSPAPHILQGDTLLAELRTREALASYERARELGAGPQIDLAIAGVQTQAGEIGEAVGLFERMATVFRGAENRGLYEQAKCGAARALMLGGKAAAALELMESSEFVMAHWQASALRLDILRAMGRLEESTAGYKKLVEDYPEAPGLRGRFAVNLALSGDSDGALSFAKKEEERYGGVQALHIRGMALRICGLAEESVKALAGERWLSYSSTFICMERLMSAVIAGDEKEIGAAKARLGEIAGKADAWRGLIWARDGQKEAVEKTFTFAENALRGAGKVFRHERLSSVAWSYEVK